MDELYQRDGYRTFGGRFPAERLARLRQAALRLVERIPEWGVDSPRLSWNHDHSAVRNVLYPADLEPAFEELITDPWLLDHLRPLLGSDIEYYEGVLVVKGPGDRTAFPWHQDLPHIPHSNASLLAAAIHLDDFTDGQGVLSIVPGSHRRGLATHRQGMLALSEDERRNAHQQHVPAGTLTIMHSLVWHEGILNHATNLRMRALYFYRAADAAPLGKTGQTSPGIGRHNGMLVCGARRPPRSEPLAYQQDVHSP